MTTPKTIDRKTFLTSAVAAISTVTLGGGCSSESDDDGGTATGGTSTGGTATGGTSTGGTATGGTSTGGTATGGTSTGGTSTGGSSGSGMTGGASGSASGGTAGSGGSGGGGTLVCMTDTDNGDHSHPLTVPASDVERGFQDAPYTLEDGGTGHTHTVELTAYEFLYLSGGMEVTTESSTDAGHMHPCVINCGPG